MKKEPLPQFIYCRKTGKSTLGFTSVIFRTKYVVDALMKLGPVFKPCDVAILCMCESSMVYREGQKSSSSVTL